jgi:hypothetical protein
MLVAWKIIIVLFLGGIQQAQAWTYGSTGLVPPADVVCTITTGNCTGPGGGSSLFTAAACNGIADDAAAFSSFNSWAVGTWQAGHSGLVQLNIPHGANCLFHGTGNCTNGASCPGQNIKQFRLVGLGFVGTGDGATFTIDAGSTGLFLGSFKGLRQDNVHSARLVSSNVGDTCVTLVTAANASLFNAGDYALITGVDMQQTGIGFPSNPYFYEWPQILSVDAAHQCGGSVAGASVTFTASLANKYLSTWPTFSNGTAFQIDQGGPSTLYALDQGWNTTQTYVGITFVSANAGGQLYAIGRDVTYLDVKFTNSNCPIPTQNFNFTVTNADLSTCNMEVDKIIGTATLTNVSINQLNFQSSSVNQFTLNNSTIASSQQGTPKKFSCSGSTIGAILIGAHSYGRTSELDFGNCVVGSMAYSGVIDKGDGNGGGGTSNPGFNFTREMSGGVIKLANQVNITNAVDQGGGVLRLTVACNTSLYPTCSDATTAFTVGLFYGIGNLVMSSGTKFGNYSVAAKNSVAHTIDINFNVFGATYTSGGSIGGNSAFWYIPGTNMSWVGQFMFESMFWQVTGITQDGNWTYIATTLAGGFPTVPTTSCSSGACIYAVTHPAPVFKCSGCSGDVNMVAMGLDPAQGPIGSYSKRTYVDGSSTIGGLQMGNISSVEYNVTAAQGSANTIAESPPFGSFVINSAGAAVRWTPVVNANSVGDRNITLSGSTCVSGVCAGDSGLAPPDATFTFLSGSTPKYTGSTTGTPVSTTATIKLNQGVVYPPIYP